MSLSTGSSSSSEDISFKPLKEKSSSLPYSLCCTSVKSFCCPKIDVAAEEGKEQLQNGADLKWFKEKTSQLPYIDDGASTVSAWSSVLELQENNVDLKYLPPKRGVRFNTKAIASEEDNDKSFSMPRKKRSFLRAIAKHLPRRRSLHPSWKDIDVAIYAKNTIEDDAHPLNCLIRRFGECRLDGNCNFIYDDPAEEEYIVKPDELPEAQEDPDYFPGLAQAEDDPANNSWDNFHWNGQDKPSMVDVNANGPKTFWCNDQWNHNEFDAVP
uniref:Uncharacterized protein n=1 Tax=Panagrolaimus superbus TaxID=310955 RepID=A0A914XTA9_9BILA